MCTIGNSLSLSLLIYFKLWIYLDPQSEHSVYTYIFRQHQYFSGGIHCCWKMLVCYIFMIWKIFSCF